MTKSVEGGGSLGGSAQVTSGEEKSGEDTDKDTDRSGEDKSSQVTPIQDGVGEAVDSTSSGLRPTDPVHTLQAELGHRFEDQGMFFEALTHRSFVNECPLPGVRDNERFEFLGDAVIDLVISLVLMQQHPTAREGQLSKMRALLVSEQSLARVAESLGLGAAMRLGRGEELSGGRTKPSLLADAFEALMAALYLDAGIEKVHDVLVRRLPLPSLDTADRGDPKTELQQRVQSARHVTPTYRLVEESGPDHAKVFVVEILVGDDVLGRGEGRTKKEAEQHAAALALSHLRLDA